MSNRSGIQAQLADAAFKTMVEATAPYCLKILDGARDLPLVNTWVNRRRSMGGGLLMLRTVTGDGVGIADLPALTQRTLRDFAGWQALAGGGVEVILECPINEKFHTDPAEFADLAEATDHFVEAATDAGFWAGVLVVSEGNPPGPNYGAGFFLQPRVLAMLRKWRQLPLRKPGKRVIWVPHGYSHPPAAAEDEYHFDRPRNILAQLPGDARLNYALGEMGCDGGCDLPDKKPGVGWTGYWQRIEDYAAWVRPQVAAVAQDPLCVGGAFFLSGADPNGRPNFVSFDVRDEVDFRPVLTEAVPGPPITWLEPAPTPEVPPMADVTLSVPTRTAHAAEGNWGQGETFGPCIGVVIHSTGGAGRTLETEYVGTINWFQNPDAGVSAHRVIGAGKFSEVCTSLHDHEKAYHAREPANTNRRGIEFAHPDGFDAVAYPDFQYEAAAELIVRWKLADAARGWVWPLKLLNQADALRDAPGIVYHRDLPAGIRDGRRDPTPPFDGVKLTAAINRWYAKLSGGTPVPPNPPQSEAALNNRVWAIAQQLQDTAPGFEAGGMPHGAAYARTQGEAIKEWVNARKGQK